MDDTPPLGAAPEKVGSARGTPPRVLYLGRNLLNGGAERVFVQYVNHASTIDPRCVLLERMGDLVAELDPQVPTWDLSAKATARLSTIRLWQEARALDRIARETGAEVVTSFLMRPHIVALTARFLFGTPFRLVLNVHEHLTDSAPFLYPRTLDRLLMRGIARHWFPRADLVVTVGNGVRDDLIGSYGLAHGRTVVLHNPLNVAEIRHRAREPADLPPECLGHPLVVAAGRLVPLKGFDWLIDAFAELDPSLGARLVILGGGPERETLAGRIRARGLGDVAFLLGFQANPWSFMARADVFVLSSLTEAFPSVVGEAFALGVPVVASDCSPGVREYVENGRCAVLVKPGDGAALAAAITRVLHDAALRARLSAHGRSRADAFLLRPMIERYERMLWRVRDSGDAVPELTKKR